MRLCLGRRRRQPGRHPAPAHLETFFHADPSLYYLDGFLGIYDDEPGELESPPSVDELLHDPDVRAIVEASQVLKPAS